MNYKRLMILLALIMLSFTVCAGEISLEHKSNLSSYLRKNWKSPENYIIDKFKQYEIIFLGENHWVKHDVELVQELIPRLYKAGVYNLGVEFGDHDLQREVDLLITSKEYDETQARRLMCSWFCMWGYKEYVDLYKKAWEFNHTLKSGERKFRIVNLNYTPNWKIKTFEKDMTPEIWKKLWFKGNPDQFMASVIQEEFINKKQKALVYMGTNHAFTRYLQPIYNSKENRFIRFEKQRAGHFVFMNNSSKVFMISLHKPWKSKTGSFTYPVNGVIDDVMKTFQDKRVGFDVRNSPFGNLRDEVSYYSYGYSKFRLRDYCDGYIYQKPFSDYQLVTIDDQFITNENYNDAYERLNSPEEKMKIKNPLDLLNAIKDQAVERWSGLK